VKLAGDSSLHYVSLRMTDDCVFWGWGSWRRSRQLPHPFI